MHWEWVLTWQAAWDGYFPRYVNATCNATGITGSDAGTRVFFLNNVPWVVPILDMLNETYRIVGDPGRPAEAVVAFRPAFNWQYEGASGGLPYNASVIADIVNAIEPGTVTYIYVIQNTPLDQLFQMVALLGPQVEVVGYQQLASLAYQREAMKRRSKRG